MNATKYYISTGYADVWQSEIGQSGFDKGDPTYYDTREEAEEELVRALDYAHDHNYLESFMRTIGIGEVSCDVED